MADEEKNKRMGFRFSVFNCHVNGAKDRADAEFIASFGKDVFDREIAPVHEAGVMTILGREDRFATYWIALVVAFVNESAARPAQFSFSLDGERYQGEYPDRAAAVRAALEHAHGDEAHEGGDVWTGENVPVGIPCVAGDHLCEMLGEQMFDQVGDVAEDWPNLTKDQMTALGEAVDLVVRDALAEARELPRFWSIVRAVKHAKGEIGVPALEGGAPDA